jgi:hypothetical protein
VFLILSIFAYRPIQITIRSEQKRLVKIRSAPSGRDSDSISAFLGVLPPIFIYNTNTYIVASSNSIKFLLDELYPNLLLSVPNIITFKIKLIVL